MTDITKELLKKVALLNKTDPDKENSYSRSDLKGLINAVIDLHPSVTQLDRERLRASLKAL